MQHPYLFFSKADVADFRLRMEADPELKARYEAHVAPAEDLLKEPFFTEAEANGKESLHANFGMIGHQIGRFCSVLGTKYVVEGDTRCAERIKEMLLHFIGFERWYAKSYTKRTPIPWHSDLCSTSATMNAGQAFDLIHDYLTPEEQDKIANGIFEKGVFAALGDWALPETRIHALDSMGHNWWSVCIAESAIALLALADHLPEEKCRVIFNEVNEALANYLSYSGNKLFNKFGNFDKQGLFYESIGYDNYGTGSLLRYLWCSERYFGRNEVIRNAIPDGLCDAVMLFSYPTEKDGKKDFAFLNYGDSTTREGLELLGKWAVRTGIDSSAIRARLKNFGVDLWDEIGNFYLNKLEGSVDYLPKTALFSSGYAMTRDTWEPNGTLFSVKSGFCWNHSHNDAGSFMIFHKGRPIFTDCGTCNYDNPLYHAYYCQDVAHSTLRVGGKGRRDEELYRGTKFPGQLIDNAEGKDFFFLQADTTGPMAHLTSRMYRNFFWLDNRMLVIFDDVFCHEENTVQFTMHYDADYTQKDNAVILDNGEYRARVTAHAPTGMILSEREGHDDHKENETRTYLEYSTPEALRTHLLIHSIELDPDDHPVTFTKLSGKNSIGLRIDEADKVRELWFNNMADGHVMHDNSNNVIAGFDTDAYLLMITRNKKDGSERVLMVCGSYLRRDGKVLISSFVKKTKEIVTEM